MYYQKLENDLQSRLDEVLSIEKIEEIKRILGDFTIMWKVRQIEKQIK